MSYRMPGKKKRASPTPEPPRESPVSGYFQERKHLAYGFASLALLIPCFWQRRLQAGDLSSHLYNAWLAQLIERGQAPGLRLAFQSTNVLFDILLKGLLGVVGAATAQRIAVALCGSGVLVGRLRLHLHGFGHLCNGGCCHGSPCWATDGSSTSAFSTSISV